MNGNAVIKDNIARYGSGVYINEGKLFMESGTITGNKAEKSGAIYFAGGNHELSGGLISDNKARYGGGAGLGESTQIAMRDSVQMQGNNADWGGGGLYQQ
jgi:hypothetical protein